MTTLTLRDFEDILEKDPDQIGATFNEPEVVTAFKARGWLNEKLAQRRAEVAAEIVIRE